MVSPELLKRYPFFAPFDDRQLRELSIIADEISVEEGQILFNECEAADSLYFLIEGDIELFYTSEEEFHPKSSKKFSAGEINPGEIFSISAVIPPYMLNASARTTKASRMIIIQAEELRRMMQTDLLLGYSMMLQVTKAVMERLIYTRVQLAAAWAD